MTQPKIKYRCIVTLEQAKQVHANIANPAVKLMITPEVVKMILEANAEVITDVDFTDDGYVEINNNGADEDFDIMTLEQFNAKWEEVK